MKFYAKNKISIDIRRDLAEKYQDNDLLDWYSKEIGDILPTENCSFIMPKNKFSGRLI
jgi:hypothetical protein